MFVEYIDIANRHSHSFDNSVSKLDVLLPLVTGELFQNTVDTITSVTYKLLNVKISRQSSLLNKKFITNKAGNYKTVKDIITS